MYVCAQYEIYDKTGRPPSGETSYDSPRGRHHMLGPPSGVADASLNASMLQKDVEKENKPGRKSRKKGPLTGEAKIEEK